MVLFGSILKPEVERLSDFDLAVELASMEADFDRARLKNYERAERTGHAGTSFPDLLRAGRVLVLGDFRILEGTEPRLRFSDYSVEKTFVLTVPQPEQIAMQSATAHIRQRTRQRRPRYCPF